MGVKGVKGLKSVGLGGRGRGAVAGRAVLAGVGFLVDQKQPKPPPRKQQDMPSTYPNRVGLTTFPFQTYKGSLGFPNLGLIFNLGGGWGGIGYQPLVLWVLVTGNLATNARMVCLAPKFSAFFIKPPSPEGAKYPSTGCSPVYSFIWSFVHS